MPMFAKVIADSLNTKTGDRITTVEILCPGPIWGEWLTHRLLSRNAGSGRAVPIKRFRETMEADPYTPKVWYAAQKGMGATTPVTHAQAVVAGTIWKNLQSHCANANASMEAAGVCKKQANNCLRPFVMVPAVVTATEWRNFLKLRCTPEAEPDMRIMAEMTRDALAASVPRQLQPGQWHLPYVTDEEGAYCVGGGFEPSRLGLCRLSAGRCAGVSFFRHGVDREAQDMIDLCCKTLEKNGHWSPLEHPAVALSENVLVGNYAGWMQFRKFFPDESGGDLLSAVPISNKIALERYSFLSPLHQA
jgi:thymidylate synthase ThyX